MIGPALLLVLAAQAQAPPHVLVVTGVGGEPKYSQAFVEDAGAVVTHLVDQYGVPHDRIVWLGEDPARAPGRIAGRSTRERVAAELAALAQRARPGEPVLVVLVGHGSDGGQPRFNLPGPDLAAEELARLLDPLGARPVAVVVAASASGGFVERLRSDTRLVITATTSGFEQNESRFARVFARALGGAAADTDKDGRLSLLEAFQFTAREVAREYEAENTLLTEHARVSDSVLARRFVITPAAARAAAEPADSAAALLLARRAALEARIEALRLRRDVTPAAEYEREFEALVLELARVNQQLRERQARKP